MSAWKWTKKHRQAAELLADGYLSDEVGAAIGVDGRSVRRWSADSTFSNEVDRLTLQSGIAARAERLKLVKRVVRQKTRPDGKLDTDKDLLDWLKQAQSETDSKEQTLNVATPGLEELLVRIYGEKPDYQLREGKG